MSRFAISPAPLKRSCRWQNDREFCAWIERRHLRLSTLVIVTTLAMTATSAVGSLLSLP